MSIYTRRRYADWRGFVTCFTCPKYAPWQEFDAGHFKHGRLDFDKRAINQQCTGCNRFWHGRLDVYAQNLVKQYGPTILNELDRAAQQEKPRTVTDYERIIQELTNDIATLDEKESKYALSVSQ